MGRWLRGVGAALILWGGALSVAPPVQAGPLSALAKVGRLAKKGSVASKAGLAVKGSKLAAATVAAEGVFRHMPLDAQRAAVFVGRSEDGVAAVMRGADSAAGEASAVGRAPVRRLLADLEEMAEAAPHGGVDVVIDPDVLASLGELTAGPRTRLWIARPDGPPLAVERVAEDRMPLVRLGPRLVSGMLTEAPRLARLAEVEVQLSGAVLWVPPEAPCGEELQEHAIEEGFVLPQGPPPSPKRRVAISHGEELEESIWVEDPGGDQVEWSFVEPCARGPEGRLRAATMISALAEAQRWGEVWEIDPDEATPAGDLAEPEDPVDTEGLAGSADLRLESFVVVDGSVEDSMVEVQVYGEGWSLHAVASLQVAQPDEPSEPMGFTARILTFCCFVPTFLFLLSLQFFPRHTWNLFRHGRFVSQLEEE